MKKFTFLIGIMMVAFFAQAQSFEELQKIYAADGSSGNHFGWSIDLGSDYLVVGQPDEYGGGSVYVFIKNNGTWIQISKIRASDTDGNNEFGESVSTDGENILVGAKNTRIDGHTCGAAYIYTPGDGTWNEQQILASDHETSDGFASDVAICGDYALIGNDRAGMTNSKAYLFHYNGSEWEEVQIIPHRTESWFGKSVAINDNMAVIADLKSLNIYKFTNDTLEYVTNLTYGSSYDEFGYSLDISDDYIVAGSWRSDEHGDDAGSAYVFHKLANMWVLNEQLIPDSVKAGDRFGSSVAVSGDYLVVGALYDYDETDSTERKGSAYIFHADADDNWELVEKIIPSDADYHTFFGSSATIRDGEIFVGAYGGDGIEGFTGAAWYYTDQYVGMSEKVQESTDLTVFPNPAGNQITVELNGNKMEYLRITDITGQTVMKKQNPETRTTVDISALSRGIYLLTAQSGKQTVTKKIIKR